MTVYEHAMLGIDAALAAGLHRRGGWQIVAWTGCAAALPDWDGLTLLAGARAYDAGHRLWGHNLLVAALVAAILGACLYRTRALECVARRAQARFPSLIPPPAPYRAFSAGALVAWAAVGILASYSHLAMDVLFSYGKNLNPWEVPLAWPFSARSYGYPMVAWGDPGPTILFAAGMLAMARWPSRVQSIAALALLGVATYIALRGALR